MSAPAFKVFVYCDKEISPPATGFDLVLCAMVGESVWGQIVELLDEAKIAKDKMSFDVVVRGVLGFRQNEFVEELAEHGNVRWEISKKSVEVLAQKFSRFKTVRIVSDS